MQFALNAEHKGARITIRYDQNPRAELHINGRLREQLCSEQSEITLTLGSSVQTGYEYHEFIEAIIQFNPSAIEVNLLASGISIASEIQLLTESVTHTPPRNYHDLTR